jgi:uncharacterized protein YrzB (UPF0473 family)
MTDDINATGNEPVVLVDEQGEEHTFIVIDVIEVDDKEYAILQPQDDELDDDEEPEAIILRFDTDSDGEEVLSDIDDDDEWEKVADAWQDIMDNEKNDE